MVNVFTVRITYNSRTSVLSLICRDEDEETKRHRICVIILSWFLVKTKTFPN